MAATKWNPVWIPVEGNFGALYDGTKFHGGYFVRDTSGVDGTDSLFHTVALLLSESKHKELKTHTSVTLRAGLANIINGIAKSGIKEHKLDLLALIYQEYYDKTSNDKGTCMFEHLERVDSTLAMIIRSKLYNYGSTPSTARIYDEIKSAYEKKQPLILFETTLLNGYEKIATHVARPEMYWGTKYSLRLLAQSVQFIDVSFLLSQKDYQDSTFKIYANTLIKHRTRIPKSMAMIFYDGSNFRLGGYRAPRIDETHIWIELEKTRFPKPFYTWMKLYANPFDEFFTQWERLPDKFLYDDVNTSTEAPIGYTTLSSLLPPRTAVSSSSSLSSLPAPQTAVSSSSSLSSLPPPQTAVSSSSSLSSHSQFYTRDWAIIEDNFGYLLHVDKYYGGSLMQKDCGAGGDCMFHVVAEFLNVIQSPSSSRYTFSDVRRHLGSVIREYGKKDDAAKYDFITTLRNEKFGNYRFNDNASMYDYMPNDMKITITTVINVLQKHIRLGSYIQGGYVAFFVRNIRYMMREFDEGFISTCNAIADRVEASSEYWGSAISLQLLVQHTLYSTNRYGFMILSTVGQPEGEGLGIAGNEIITSTQPQEMQLLNVAFLLHTGDHFKAVAYRHPYSDIPLQGWFGAIHGFPNPLLSYILNRYAQYSEIQVLNDIRMSKLYQDITPSPNISNVYIHLPSGVHKTSTLLQLSLPMQRATFAFKHHNFEFVNPYASFLLSQTLVPSVSMPPPIQN